MNAGGDQSVHGSTQKYHAKWRLSVRSFPVRQQRIPVINNGGWQVVKDGAQVSDTTVNNSGRLSVVAGGKASDVIINAGGALGDKYGCGCVRHQPARAASVLDLGFR